MSVDTAGDALKTEEFPYLAGCVALVVHVLQHCVLIFTGHALKHTFIERVLDSIKWIKHISSLLNRIKC